MPNNKRYTWTISVIAVYNEKEPALVSAYHEFEACIKNISNPSKDIRFVIFFYDSVTEMAQIRKFHIVDGHLRLKVEELGKVDLYETDHTILVDFFKSHVARTRLDEDEEHKHFFITWGHSAGLGFFKTEIKSKLYQIYEEPALTSDNRQTIEWLTEKIANYNTVMSHLGLDKNVDAVTGFKSWVVNKVLSDKRTFNKEEIIKQVKKLFQVITPVELAAVLRAGLANDQSVISVNDRVDFDNTARIQIMLCLSCYVNVIETVFSFENIVNVYIAPQTEIPFYGYNYRILFQLLNDQPGVSERDIATLLTHSYLMKYLDPVIRKQLQKAPASLIPYRSGVAFSAVYVQHYRRIALAIKQFVDFICKTSNSDVLDNRSVQQVLVDARNMCFSMAGQGSTDFGIIDYENFISEVLLQLQFVARKGAEDYYYFDHIISDYIPGAICRLNYRISTGELKSQSPGSYSIFLPDYPLSDLEQELLMLYKEAGSKAGSFVQISGWNQIIDALKIHP